MTRADHVWWWKCRLPERRGLACTVLARGRMNSVLIEFACDGLRVVTSRYAIRKRKPDPPAGGPYARFIR